MYSKNIKICKFNLFKKCKFGDKCKFRHINADHINQMLVDLQLLKAENDLLKKAIQQKNKTTRNLKINEIEISANEVHACDNRLYSSFFKNIEPKSPLEITKRKHKRKERVISISSGIEEDMDCCDQTPNESTPKQKESPEKYFGKSIESKQKDKHNQSIQTRKSMVSSNESRQSEMKKVVTENYRNQRQSKQSKPDKSSCLEEKIRKIQINLNNDLIDKINQVIKKVNIHEVQIEDLNLRVTDCEAVFGKATQMIEDICRKVAPMANIEKMVKSLCLNQD